MTPEARRRGEAELLLRPSVVTDADVEKLARIAGVSVEELLETPDLPRPMATPCGARGQYWRRSELLEWWRSR